MRIHATSSDQGAFSNLKTWELTSGIVEAITRHFIQKEQFLKDI